MRNNYITYFVCVFLLVSCSIGDNPANKRKYENSTFIHLLYKNQRECMEAQNNPDFFINCHQQIDFLENHQARVIFSDIIYEANYQFNGKKIILTFDQNPEVSNNEMVMDILNKNTLRNSENNVIWKRMKGESIWD